MKSKKDIVSESIKQIRDAGSYWADNNKKYRANVDFVLGLQWEDESTSYLGRKRDTRLTFNMLYPYLKSIMGEQLQNTPDITVRAGSSDIEQWEVNLQEGIIRGIFYDSDLPQKTYSVFFNQLAGGFGAYRICTDYDNPMSFEQNIKVEQEEDPTLCYWDPDAKDKNKVTGNFCGRYVAIPEDEFEDEFDIASPQGFAIEDVSGGTSLYMQKQDHVVIAEHWRKEWRNATVYQLDDGTTCTKEEYEPYVAKMQQEYTQKVYVATLNGQQPPSEPPIPQIVKQKRDRVYKIKYYKLLTDRILEEKDWPSNYLPLVYVDGDSMRRKGRQEIKSFCQFAKDPQRFYNYIVSQISQQIKNFRREQWVGTPENMQGKGVKEMWQNPEEQTGILLAKRDEAGQLPTKAPPSQISPDLLNAKQFLTADIQNILGRHEASQGQQAPEVSGIALFNRIIQDNMGSYLQINNLSSAIVTVAMIAVDMVPRLYDSEREIITRDKKGEPMVTTINKFNGVKTNEDGTYDAEQVYYENQITQKKFRVELAAGPMFAAQKQIEFNKLVQLAGLMPQELLPALIDIIAENIDLPNTNQIVKRLRTMVPKQMLMQSGELSEEEQQEVEQQMQQQQAQQQQQPPPPEMQVQMQRNQIDMQKLDLEKQRMQRQAQNDEVQNYLDGLQIQVDLEKIQNAKESEKIGLQKDIIKTNAELQTAAMNAMHQMHKTNSTHNRAGAT